MLQTTEIIRLTNRESCLNMSDHPSSRHYDAVEIDKVTESVWSSCIDGFDDASFYQAWAYGAVRWGAKNLSHLILKRGQQVVGMAQLRILRPSNIPAGVAYLRWGPLCQPHGLALDPEIVTHMAKALRQEYVTRRGLYLEILPNAFSGTGRAQIFESAFAQFERRPYVSPEGYRTLLLDVSPPLEELRRKLDKKWRNQLNAAERNDLKITVGDGGEPYRRFRALYAEMLERKQFQTAVNVDEFEQIQARLPETQKMRILICEHAGEPVAGLVYSAIGESAIFLLGASNEAGKKVKASYLLQWTTLRLLKEMGVRYYDLGGINPAANPGVYHFKSGLSGSDVTHIRPFSACESPFSAALVRTGQLARSRFRGLQQLLSRQAAEAS